MSTENGPHAVRHFWRSVGRCSITGCLVLYVSRQGAIDDAVVNGMCVWLIADIECFVGYIRVK